MSKIWMNPLPSWYILLRTSPCTTSSTLPPSKWQQLNILHYKLEDLIYTEILILRCVAVPIFLSFVFLRSTDMIHPDSVCGIDMNMQNAFPATHESNISAPCRRMLYSRVWTHRPRYLHEHLWARRLWKHLNVEVGPSSPHITDTLHRKSCENDREII